MTQRKSIILYEDFGKDLHPFNHALLLGLIVITFGLYIINWIYLKNKEFNLLDKESPDPNRGAVLLMILPFSWFFTYFTLSTLLFQENLLLNIINILVSASIYLLIMKYILDFCQSFGRLTNTFGPIWFFGFLLGSIGIIGLIIQKAYLLPFIFFLIIVVPAMQAELNVLIYKLKIRKEKMNYYH